MNNTVIKLRDISKKRGQTEILNHLNMTVYQKDIYGFIGQNGAGKSTTMKIIMSLIKETQGQLELFTIMEGLTRYNLYTFFILFSLFFY